MRSSRIAHAHLEAQGGAAFENLRATLERAEEVEIEEAAHGFLLVLAEELHRDLHAAERFLKAASAAPPEDYDPLALVGSLDALGRPPAPINAALRAARRDDALRRLDAEFARLERLERITDELERESDLRTLLTTLGFTSQSAKVESFELTQAGWRGWQGAFRAKDTLFRISYHHLESTVAWEISIAVPASAPNLSLRRRRFWQRWSPKARYTGDRRFDLAFLITTSSSRKRVAALFSAAQRKRLLQLRRLRFTMSIDEEVAHLGWSRRIFSDTELDMRKALDFLYILSADLWRGRRRAASAAPSGASRSRQ